MSLGASEGKKSIDGDGALSSCASGMLHTCTHAHSRHSCGKAQGMRTHVGLGDATPLPSSDIAECAA